VGKNVFVSGTGIANLNNLLVGGNFEDTTYWNAYVATYTVSNNILDSVYSSGGTWAQIRRKDIAVTSGHIYYARVYVKYSYSSTHNKAALQLKTSSTSNPIKSCAASSANGSWEMLSCLATVNYDNITFTLVLPYTNSSGANISGLHVYWKEPLLIDLTSAFGSGNEPTQAWCDSNIAFFEDSTAVENSNVSNVARSVSKMNVGVSNVARNVAVGYLGVSNVARQFFGEVQPLTLFDADNGGDNTAVTGGWVVTSRHGTDETGQTLTVSSDKMYYDMPNNSAYWSGMCTTTVNSYNFAGYTKLRIVGSISRSGTSESSSQVVIGYRSNKSTSDWWAVENSDRLQIKHYEQNYAFDETVSMVFPDSNKYITIGFCEGSGSIASTLTITKLILEN